MRKFDYDSKKRERFAQAFEKEKVIMKGQEICLYDLIQNSNVDTEIYPTLKKYGCLDFLKLDANKTYGDFTEIKNLRDAIEISERGAKLFNSLPADVKEEFNNNPKEFLKNGEAYLKSKMQKPQVVVNPAQEQQTEVKGAENE